MNHKKAYSVVVAYNPDMDVLLNLIIQLSKQYDKVILSDNGGGKITTDYKIHNLIYMNNGYNIGLGAALNKALRYCEYENALYVALFDQDSSIPNNHLDDLMFAHDQLKKQDIKCIATAPLFYDRREALKKYFPFYKRTNYRIRKINPLPLSTQLVEVDWIITSGMLINMTLFDKHFFNEELVVDYTDTEWCFRVGNVGCKLYGVAAVTMGHALSDEPARRVMGFWLLKYSPLRRYYYTRNTINLLKLSYVPFAYKLRLLGGSMIRIFTSVYADEGKLNSFKAIVLGFKDGFSNKTGLIDKKTLQSIKS